MRGAVSHPRQPAPFTRGGADLDGTTRKLARGFDSPAGHCRDKFRVELDKQTLDNRGIAGELLLRRAEKIKTRFGEDIRLGRFAGFDLSIRAGFNNTAELILRAKTVTAPHHRHGPWHHPLARIGGAGFEERAARLESDIKDSQKRAIELEAKVGSPFEKEERYHKLVNRQSEIEEKLDLTKNQAPNQLRPLKHRGQRPS